MNGPPTEIETRQLAELIQAIDDLRRRVAALESQSLPAAASVAPPMESRELICYEQSPKRPCFHNWPEHWRGWYTRARGWFQRPASLRPIVWSLLLKP